MHGLQTLIWRNRKGAPARRAATIDVDLAGRTPFAPLRPKAGVGGVCRECGRNLRAERWEGACSRCEPAED